MRGRGLVSLPALALAIMLLVGSAAAVAAQSREQSRERIEYWRTKYQELKPTDDPRAAKAQVIFQRVVQVAGKRPGVVPSLFIAARDPWDIALPIALPDGWIILSKGVLDICYQEPARGDDRLAFVLAHEIAHQLNDDFWHMRFFQAFEASQARAQVSQEFLEEIRRTSSTTEHVLARELQADERGIIYAALAGFNPSAIVAEGHGVNFFADWVRALDPRRIGGGSTGPLRPTPQERAEALRAHLRRVASTTALFQVGLWFYYAGEYPQAIRAFEEFRAFFPGREVHHNLAASHHQLALQAYQAWKQDVPALPLQLSLAIDPLTRASRIYLEGPKRGGAAGAAEPAAVFRHHLDQAIALYREALAHDAAYTPAAINLGCALIVRGLSAEKRGLNADVSEAVTTLLRALELDPTSPEMLNNLGVALFYGDRADQAKEHLARAQTLAPTYAAPVFNLGQIAHTEHREDDARHYGQVYEQLAPRPPPGPPTATPGTESVLGLGVGQLEDRVPQAWGTPTQSQLQVERRTLAVATYPAGVMTLAQDREIRMIMVREGFQGATARGIRIGSAARDVLAHYGSPARRVELTQGQSWGYDAHRMAFQLRDGRVISWLLF
jgi:tetratricopeptide (TPR) repeat protein